LHQGSDAEAKEWVTHLETVLKTYYTMFRALGIGLRMPAETLVTVRFGSQEDYLAQLRKESGTAFLNTKGYYHPTRRVVLVYDSKSEPKRKRAWDALRARRKELEYLQDRIESAPKGARLRVQVSDERAMVLDRPSARQKHAELSRQVDRDALELELDRRTLDWAVAAHEMVHQLVAVSAIAPSHDAFPQWLHEGLAMQFEPMRGGRWAGIAATSDFRLKDWRDLPGKPSLISLANDDGFGQGYRQEPYAKAWALVYFLRTRNPERFVRLIDRLRLPGQGRGPDRNGLGLDALRAVLEPGEDLKSLEAEWIQFMNSLRTPLEIEEPQPGR
jgi:hypothetical protein